MELPPVEERGMLHRKTVFYDPFTSYKEYKDNKIVDDYFE